MKRFFSILLVLMMLLMTAAPAYASSYKDSYSFVVRIYSDIAVDIYNYDTEEYITSGNLSATGTGFAVGEIGKPVQYFVTNRHVVEVDDSVMTLNIGGVATKVYVDVQATQPYIIYSNSTEKVIVNVFEVSDRCDLAVISLNEPTDKRSMALVKAPLQSSDVLHDMVYAAGFPGISDTFNDNGIISTFNSYETDLTITSGLANTIKQDAVTGEGEIIQHVAKISGGNSGGPLMDEKGHIVGVNYAHWVEDGDYALAVSANELSRFLEEARVPYTTVDEYNRHQITIIALIAAAVIVLLAVIAVVIVLQRKKSGASSATGRVLVCKEGALAGKRFDVKGTMRIGYDAARCQIVYPVGTPGVSGLHCSITFDGKVVTVTDENSRHGTWLDQTRLTPGDPVVMHRGQTLYFGSKKQSMTLGS